MKPIGYYISGDSDLLNEIVQKHGSFFETLSLEQKRTLLYVLAGELKHGGHSFNAAQLPVDLVNIIPQLTERGILSLIEATTAQIQAQLRQVA